MFACKKKYTHVIVLAQEDQVAACFDGHDSASLDANFLIKCLHLEAFGDGYAIEAQFLPQQIIDDLIREASMRHVHGGRGDAATANKDSIKFAGCDGIPIRDQSTEAQFLEGLSNDGNIEAGASKVKVAIRGEVLATGCNTSVLVTPDGCNAILRDLLRIVAAASDTDRLEAGIRQHIENRANDKINADGRNLLSCGLGYIVCHIEVSRGSQAHGTGELADVIFVKQAVDAAIFLVESDEQGARMACLVSDILELLDELGCLVSSLKGEPVSTWICVG